MTIAALRGFLVRHDKPLRSLCKLGFAISVVTVCVLSLLPSDDLPSFEMSDKVSHLIAYSEIVTVGLLAFRGRHAFFAVTLGTAALGGVLEIAQAFVPGRSSDILDFTVNCVGILLGILLARGLTRLWPTPAGPVAGRAA